MESEENYRKANSFILWSIPMMLFPFIPFDYFRFIGNTKWCFYGQILDYTN